MKFKLKYMIFGFMSVLLINCAMENRKVSNEDLDDIILTEEVEAAEAVEEIEVVPTFNSELINQKLQDFYDLVALQNEHPEFMDEVSDQLKKFTTDSISSFKTDDFAVIENVRQIGISITVNDSVEKIKLSYEKIIDGSRKRDTIYAIITSETVIIDGEALVSRKVRFSKD